MIKKIVSGALAALTLGSVALAGPASAQPRWHGGYHDGWRGDRGAAVVGAGVLGLALGAALTQPHYYAPRPAYYAPRYGYACGSHYRWDRYLGRYVLVTNC